MTFHIPKIGAALLALFLVLVLPASGFAATHQAHQGALPTIVILGLGLGLAGTISITYEWPYTTGSTNPPSQALMSGHNLFSAQVVFSQDTDGAATVTHNMQFSTQELTQFVPIGVVTQTAGNTAPAIYTLTLAANTATFTKVGTTAGGAGTTTLQILRPHTINR